MRQVFKDGHFEFFTAISEKYNTIYRVRIDSVPEKRAIEKDIDFLYIRKSSYREIESWKATHPSYPILEETK